MHPGRGQVLRVKAPWIKECIVLEHEVTYILPIDDVIVLGGTYDLDNYDLSVQQNVSEDILKRCFKLLPSLKHAEIVKEACGLRPCRSNGVRLELETIDDVKIIHNYGHGGAGVTLAWGIIQ